MRKLVFLAIVAMGLCIAIGLPHATAMTVTVGTIGSGGNAFPFGSTGSSYPGTTYQQVYNQALFTEMYITGVTFFNSGGSSIDGATYTMYLSTTTKAVNGLDTATLSNNVGTDNMLFKSEYLSGNPGSSFTFSGPAFLYNPANGNLLVEILKSGGSVGSYTGWFDAMNGNFGTDSSRAHDFGTGFEQFGLVTQFSSSSVPLPGALLLFGPGLVGLAAIRRRFRK